MVVLDNLSAHRHPEAVNAIEAKGACGWHRPPYSPNFNPIEKRWSKVRTLLRKAMTSDSEALSETIDRASAAVSKTDRQDWSASCGYSLI